MESMDLGAAPLSVSEVNFKHMIGWQSSEDILVILARFLFRSRCGIYFKIRKLDKFNVLP